MAEGTGQLLAISDLHITYAENRAVVEPRPTHDDWLIVAGDVGELGRRRVGPQHARQRFAQVVWAPGNHELWTPRKTSPLRGEHRYQHLVALCRRLGVVTPEDPYPVWDGPGGPVAVAPLFVLYDYTFLPPG